MNLTKYKMILINGSIAAVLLVSCEESLDKKIEGNWAINSIKYESEDVLLSFYSNIISFDRDSCFIPISMDHDSDSGEWEIRKEQGQTYLVIETEKNLLADKYVLRLEKDNDKKLLILHLTSPTTEIIAAKMHHYFKE